MSGQKRELILLSEQNAVILKNILCKDGIDAFIEPIEGQEHLCRNYYSLKVNEDDYIEAVNDINNVISFDSSETKGNKCKNVLVPVDFSNYSLIACDAAFRYAYRHNLNVCILHSYISESYSETLPPGIKIFSERIRKERSTEKKDIAYKQMAVLENEIREQIANGAFPDVKFEVVVEEGIPEDVIAEYSNKNMPAIIVMGTRGTHQKDEDLIGSVTAEVIDSAEVPMMIIPNGINPTEVVPVKNIAIYCNLDQSDVETFKMFFSRFDTVDCNVSLVHIKGKREKFVIERIDAFCRYCNSEYPYCTFEERLFDENTFLDEFDKYLKEKKTKLLVLPNKKRNIFMRLFNPSIAHKLFFHTDIAMIVIPTHLND